MDSRRSFGLAVPNYEKMGIQGPYLGDRVWEELEKLQGLDGEFGKIPITVIPFTDNGEKVIIDANVREKDIYVIHPLQVIPAQHVMIAAEIADDLHRSDAKRVFLFEPYNPYYRQDARQAREPITARLVGDLYDASGITGVFTLEPHSKQLAGFFRYLEPLPMIGELASHIANDTETYDVRNAVVLSPDEGGQKRATEFANLLGLRKAYADKTRQEGETVDVNAIVGDIEGKDVYLVDDIVGTGVTVVENIAVLKKLNARNIIVVAAHLGLYNDAVDRLRNSGVYRIVGTNSIPYNEQTEDRAFVDRVDIAPILAGVIYKKAKGGSISQYFQTRLTVGNGPTTI